MTSGKCLDVPDCHYDDNQRFEFTGEPLAVWEGF